MHRPLSQEDMIGQEVTSSLKRMLETMRNELDRSSKNIATAKSSSTAISGTATNYRKIDSKLDDTRGLVRDLKKKDRGDKLFVLGAFGVLLATVAFILFQRSPELVKLPARLAFDQVQRQVSSILSGLNAAKGAFDVREYELKAQDQVDADSEATFSESDSAAEAVETQQATSTVQQTGEIAETAAPEIVSSSVIETSGTATSRPVTFAEYESEPLIFNDQQIVIEITTEPKSSEVVDVNSSELARETAQPAESAMEPGNDAPGETERALQYSSAVESMDNGESDAKFQAIETQTESASAVEATTDDKKDLQTTDSVTLKPSAIVTDSDDSDVENLLPNSQLNLDESSYDTHSDF
jgi:hypothetical protein